MASIRATLKNSRLEAALPAVIRINRHLKRTSVEREEASLYRRVGRPSTMAGGPCRGMSYIQESTCGAILPKMFGTCEPELQPLIESAVALGPDLTAPMDSPP